MTRYLLFKELPHYCINISNNFTFSFVLIQKKQKIKAVNCLTAGFSSTRHHLNGPSDTLAVIKDSAGAKCCHSVTENTLFPSTNSRPVNDRKQLFLLIIICDHRTCESPKGPNRVWCYEHVILSVQIKLVGIKGRFKCKKHQRKWKTEKNNFTIYSPGNLAINPSSSNRRAG